MNHDAISFYTPNMIKMNKKYLRVLIIGLFSSILIGCSFIKKSKVKSFEDKQYTDKLSEIDGPYIYDKIDSVLVVTVEEDMSDFYIVNRRIKKEVGQTFVCRVNNTEKDSFRFELKKDYTIPKDVYEAPEKLFVTSDIEGNFNTFYSMLVGNHIMDKDYNWIYGKGHLVIAGDMVDRGNNAWPCLWLLYKLELEAEKHGGRVHYILGNHDVMNMHGNLRYVKKRYIELAKILSGKEDEKEAFAFLLANTNEIVKWIATKNTVEKIGNNLYLHGGIGEEIVDAGLSISKINEIVRKNIRKNLTNYPEDNKLDNLVFGRTGPLWYRGLVIDYKEYYKKIEATSLQEILDFYKVERIIIGHTIVADEVTYDFAGRVIRVDISHPTEKFTGKSKGLLIESNKFYRTNDLGEKTEMVFQ